MDKRVLRERMRRKKRQMMIRRYTRLGLYVVGLILAIVFVVRGIIIPVAHRVTGGGNTEKTVEAQAQTEQTTDPNAAVRQPLKGKSDTDKIGTMTVGWHEDSNGKWYQNADGTYYAGGFQDIDGQTYAFDSNGYLQTGWVTKGVNDYFFKDDGTYDPSQKRPMLALTFDDGPYAPVGNRIMDCAEQYGGRVTFYVVGNRVNSYKSEIQRMYANGHEIGNHTQDHKYLQKLGAQEIRQQVEACNQAVAAITGEAPKTVRLPGGGKNSTVLANISQPIVLWNVDTLDWKTRNAASSVQTVLNQVKDGSVVLMHELYNASGDAAVTIIPALVERGYQLVTVSELAQFRGGLAGGTVYYSFHK